MGHLQSFQVTSYRGLDGLDLPRIAPRANLFTGKNAVGKTSLLEAIWLFHGRFNPALLWNLNVRRSPVVLVDPVARLGTDRIQMRGEEDGLPSSWQVEFVPFSNAASRKEAMNGGNGPTGTTGSAGPARTIDPNMLPVPPVGMLRVVIDGEELDPRDGQDVQMTEQGPVLHPVSTAVRDRADGVLEGGIQNPLLLSGDLMDTYSRIVRAGRKAELLGTLSAIVGVELGQMDILTDAQGAHIWAATGDSEARPLADFGGGAMRLFRLAVNCSRARGGLLLVDEIENGLHHSVLPEFWSRLAELARASEVQIFAATHSHECIDAAIGAFGEESSELAVHGLYRETGDETVRSTFFSGETLAAARDLDFELR